MNVDSLVLFVQSETAYMYKVCDLTTIKGLTNIFSPPIVPPWVMHYITRIKLKWIQNNMLWAI